MEDRYDWVMVQVEDAGKAARRLAAGLLDGEDEPIIELDRQTESLLDDALDQSRITFVDPRTAALILRPPSRVRAYARLLAYKSDLLHELGHERQGHSLARRALELQLEAADLEPDPDAVDRLAIEALLDRDPPLRIGARQRELLAGLDGPSS